jgi:hypothetical protein
MCSSVFHDDDDTNFKSSTEFHLNYKVRTLNSPDSKYFTAVPITYFNYLLHLLQLFFSFASLLIYSVSH